MIKSRLDQKILVPEAKWLSVSSRWVYENDLRLDSSNYATGTVEAFHAVMRSPHQVKLLGSLCGKIWHPVQNQARSNFKRIYTKAEFGVPFVSSRNMFDLPLRPHRFLSKKMRKLDDLRVPEGWLLVSRSGTVGNVLFVRQQLADCAISDHAIRVEVTGVPAGYLYAFLCSCYGQPLIAKGVFGATVDELEPAHLRSIPVCLAPEDVQEKVHDQILKAYRLRDAADKLIVEADSLLHNVLGLSPFTDDDIEYLPAAAGLCSFSTSFKELNDRFDASHHVPLARSVVNKLKSGRIKLTPLSNMCSKITIPARFKRRYVDRGRGTPYLLPSQLMAQRPLSTKEISNRQANELPGYLLRAGELLLTTDGTVGRVHPVTARTVGWFGSNNMARIWDPHTDMGFLFAFLSTPYGQHQVAKDIYGGVIDHINESHIASVLCPLASEVDQCAIGDLIRRAFAHKDVAANLEDQAIDAVEAAIRG